ncbi:aspartate aminotransferase family protein [Virgibacillus pantothenticus]|uniref:aminotransferase family protein n=1 Tax=Virgibacillus pantothenticus TaxID=1473 RepID=UPI001B1A0970|nr:aspartate aminotransferase family protein [Virgibacillus pantothenticus]MBU8565351.1 aspartate aminotransferase family protein [Virgibacillus pantothenticus]MBU8599429.1 aspartate aminotransferase family protein [Virgibacillus pantothenticus]MBU8633671.1 aspartate aminotransferase family protein [Virgibacillus pantothenticus]MBU8641709.1 aspartate aminotransferase family protein [Virgibacillus pantothenticus]MBU8645550.1 aspartate aminotransferase family protein [Virgibacillus pantothenticu
MSNNLIEMDKRHFIHPTSSIQQQQKNGAKVIMEEGDGIYLKDITGKWYLDAVSSLWNVNIGHGREELAKAAAEQMKKMAFSSAFSTFSHEPAIRLAEKIASLTPEGLNAVFFTSGGSESNDSAVKLVRHYWKIQNRSERRKIISLKRGYHGVAAASTSVTGIPEFWGMAGHMMTDFIHVDTHYNSTTDQAIASLRQAIEESGPETVAAFFAEPIQGAGGVLIPPDDYFPRIRALCDDYGILFVADEVITGFGRTGKMFGIENWDVIPDVMTFAKGVTSGYFPLGGVVVSETIHNVFKEKSLGTLFHGFTYSGHPTGAAVALKNIEIMEQEQLVENSRLMGNRLLLGLKKVKESLEIVGDVRFVGLLGAVELVEEPVSNKRFAQDQHVTLKAIEALHERGVICRGVTYDNTDIICIAPPLIINQEQVDQLVEGVYEAILKVQQQLGIKR